MVAGTSAGLFGTAVATTGMLSTCAYILAMDTFGPITDNAGGIAEMSGQPVEVRHRTDRLDSVGNTTKALTKGYAIGSAALAAFLLFSAYIDEVNELLVKKLQPGAVLHQLVSVDIAKPPIFVAALIGAALVILFSSLAIQAVGKSAFAVIQEVRRQFHADPGIMAGTSKPDYGACVDMVTKAALNHMVAPGLLAVGVPIGVGLFFRFFNTPDQPTVAAEAVAGLLDGRHYQRHPLGHLHEQRRRRMGQREEADRDRNARRQEHRTAPRSRSGRHRGRSVQGHRRALHPRAHQAALHRDVRDGAAVPLAQGSVNRRSNRRRP